MASPSARGMVSGPRWQSRPARPRQQRPGLATLALGAGLVLGPLACGTPAPTVEAGALLVRVTVPAGAPKPEELRLWAYDDGGLIFGDVRVPNSGSLPSPKGDGTLGTVLVQPGTLRGALRLHLRAMAGGVRTLDGIAAATAAQIRSGNLALALSFDAPDDADGDDVPDGIDDCVGQANPAQGGCAPDTDAGTNGGAGGAGTGGESTPMGGAGGDGVAGRAGTGGAASGGAPNVGGTAGSRTGGAGTAGAAATGGMGTGGARTGGMGTGGARTGGMGTGGAPKALGTPCGTMAECASGFCVDGVCCESSCTTECRTCATGRCLEVRRGEDIPQCMGNMSCNNAAKCVGG